MQEHRARIDPRERKVADEAAHRNRLREAILRHLRAHPFAADTAEGIVSNWLVGFADARTYIDSVLEDMTQKSLLRAYRLPGGRVLYKKGAAAR
jgi:hypothetical protein